MQTATEQEFVETIYCPFPAALHTNANTAERLTAQWGQHWGLLQSPRTRARFERLRYGIFMGQAYPYTTTDRLILIADFNTWLFTLDDRFDEGALGRNPQALLALHNECIDIMHGAPAQRTDDPWLNALPDLRERFLELGSATWWTMFVGQLARSFAASRWEARNRQAARTPSEANYRRMRRYTGAVYVFFDLIEFAEGVELPDALRTSTEIQALRCLANHVICWFNDIVSLPKELRAGDMHNYVLVMQQQRNIPLDAAVDQVIQLHNREAAKFERKQHMLSHTASPHDILMNRYAHALAIWMRANYDWSLQTIRYRS